MSAPAPAKPVAKPSRSSESPWRRLLIALVGIPLVTTGVLWGWMWWAERPLRAVERALSQHDFNRALELVDQYLKGDPYSSRALDLRGQSFVGLKRFPEALQIYERIGTDTLAGQKAWSEALLNEGRWSDALPLLRQVDRRQPADPLVVHELATCAMQVGEFDEAVRKAEELTQIPGHFERGSLLLGVLHTNHGNYRLACEAFEKLLAANPEGTGLQIGPDELFQGLGQAYLSDGRPDEAIARLTQAIEFGGTAERYAFLGDAWELQGDLDQARDAWREAVGFDPNQTRAREGLARQALETGKPAEAIEWLTPLTTPGRITSAIAHTLKRASQLQGKREDMKLWEGEEARLREVEERRRVLNDLVKQSPRSYWALAIRAHKFATDGNRYQAAVLLQTIDSMRRQKPDANVDPRGFVDKLTRAVNDGDELPPLELVPIEKH